MFDSIYKRGREHCGSIWSGRFASTLIQDGEYLARCKRYVVYNPVCAGIVSQARDYRWSWSEDNDRAAVFVGPRGMVSREGGADRGREGVRKLRVRHGVGVFAGRQVPFRGQCAPLWRLDESG